MAQDKAFRKLSDLVAALSAAERDLGAGSLGLEGLETACGDARELYERLVVLRHKAREAAAGTHGTVSPAKPATIPAPEVVKKESIVEEPVQEAPSIRLDTRPSETMPRQKTLIEAIEETEQEPESVNATADTATAKSKTKSSKASVEGKARSEKAATSAPSVAEKLEKASIADLSKAISLSHKFWFVAELFNGDRITYDKSIDRLNSFGDLSAAQAFVEEEVIAKLKKPADPEAVATFTDLVQRRYA